MRLGEQEILGLYAGARVALVGNAASTVGTCRGESIEGADVVVRCNFGAPVPAWMRPDVGRRTDVLYAVLIAVEGGRPIDGSDTHRWMVGGVQRLVSTLPPAHPRTLLLPGLCDPIGLDWSAVHDAREMVRVALRRHGARRAVPNTGIVALKHIVSARPARVDVYGFDFYASGHWPGQGGESPAAAAAQVGGGPSHDQAAHRKVFAEILADHPEVRHHTA